MTGTAVPVVPVSFSLPLMNVFYEEDGGFKVGAVLADNVSSLQVEAPHGRRAKIKASSVILRFEQPVLAGFIAEAQQAADAIDIDFLWECCGADEFMYDALARDYYGHVPGPVEGAAVLLRLHGAPMYFYKKGRGRYKAAPPEALKAALASIERKRQQALQKDRYLELLLRNELPAEFTELLPVLLYRPDKAAIEWKALEEAAGALKVTPVRLLEQCGAVPSTHDYHVTRFVQEYLPRVTSAASAPIAPIGELPEAAVAAFSIDDAATTEIDDAFSLTELPNGNRRVGIHIAAPALGVPVGSPLDVYARERLSTVYFPGGKFTMLPEEAIAEFTLSEGRSCPALSLYAEVAPDFTIAAIETRLERVPIAENLRHATLENQFNDESLALGHVAHARGSELAWLWQWAKALERGRRGDEPEGEQRPEYSFQIDGERVAISRRQRGTPIDKLVSELMIFANSSWGKTLAESDIAAIYRVQAYSKVRMSSVPAGHQGLGVSYYTWASSPLRRYVDLVNQRQLIAAATAAEPPYHGGDEALLGAMRDFEAAYDAYAEFQRGMERYWCLRWLLQEGVETVKATVLRDNLVRFDDLPLVMRVPSLPVLEAGAHIDLTVGAVDLLELTLHCEFRARADIPAVPETTPAA
jgi:exoribonuclease II